MDQRTVLVSFFLLLTVDASLTVAYYPNMDTYVKATYESALSSLQPFTDTLEGRLVSSDSHHSLFNGSIVLYTYFTGSELVNNILRFQSLGAIGVVVYTSLFRVPGQAYLLVELYYKYASEPIDIIVVQIVRAEAGYLVDLIQNTSLYVNCNITDDTPNLWKEASESLGFSVSIQVIAVLSSIISAAYASYGLFYSCRDEESKKKKIPIFVNASVIANSLFRAFYAAVDPLLLRSIFPYFLSQFLCLLTIPFSFINSFILLFQWNKALNALKAKRIPKSWENKVIIAFSVTLVVLEIVSAVFRGLELATEFYIFVLVLYTLLAIVILVYIIYTTYNLWKFLADKPEDGLILESRLRALRITKIIFAHGVILAATIITYGLIIIIPAETTPYAFYAIWAFIMVFLNAVGILQVHILIVPDEYKKKFMSSSVMGKHAISSRNSRNNISSTANTTNTSDHRETGADT